MLRFLIWIFSLFNIIISDDNKIYFKTKKGNINLFELFYPKKLLKEFIKFKDYYKKK